MIGSFKILAAAALLAVSLGSGACLAEPVESAPAPLNEVTKANFDQEVLKSAKPVIAIVVDAKTCTTFESLIEKAAQAHPEAKFVKVDGAAFGVPADKVPVLASFAPGASRYNLFEKANFVADATFDDFLKARIDAAAKAIAAQKSIDDAQAQVKIDQPRLQTLYQTMKAEEKAQRIALNEKLAWLFKTMADGNRAIADVLKSERQAAQ